MVAYLSSKDYDLRLDFVSSLQSAKTCNNQTLLSSDKINARCFRLIEGQKDRAQITNVKRSKRVIMVLCIPFILSRSPIKCWRIHESNLNVRIASSLDLVTHRNSFVS